MDKCPHTTIGGVVIHNEQSFTGEIGLVFLQKRPFRGRCGFGFNCTPEQVNEAVSINEQARLQALKASF